MSVEIAEILPFFRNPHWEKVPRGWVAVVKCDRDRPKTDIGLVGKDALIGGHIYRVTGVEVFMHAGPVREGERIGLLIDGEPKFPTLVERTCRMICQYQMIDPDADMPIADGVIVSSWRQFEPTAQALIGMFRRDVMRIVDQASFTADDGNVYEAGFVAAPLEKFFDS